MWLTFCSCGRWFALACQRPASLATCLLLTCGLVALCGCSADDSSAMTSVTRVVRTALPHPYRIELTGRNHEWLVRYPDAQGNPRPGPRLITSSIRVPANLDIEIVLRSDDYVYSVAVPELDIQQIAVPNLHFAVRFRSGNAAKFELLTEELCGLPAPETPAQLIVEPQTQFADWLKRRFSSR